MTSPDHTRRDLIDLTVALAEINSVNTTLDAGGGGEAEIGEFVRDWMSKRGWQVDVEWPAPGRPNVVGVIKGGPGPTLMINVHLDTVGGVSEAFEVKATDDRILGRGVLDTKGGLAAALLAAASIDPDDLPGDIVIAAVCDEEADSIGTSHLLLNRHPDAAIVIEPTDLRIVAGHRGFGILEVVYLGRAAHTGHREEGINAIDPATRLVADLASLERSLSERPVAPLFGAPSIQVTRIEGGTELFTVPDRCTTTIEIRTVPGHHEADMATVVDVVQARSADGVECRTDWLIRRPPFSTDVDDRLVQTATTGLESAGRSAVIVGAPFWTDAALFSSVDVPAVVIGPGGHGIHSVDEWVSIDDLVATQQVLRHAMTNFAAPQPPNSGDPK